MSVLRVLSSEGDTATVWHPAQVRTGDPEAIAAVREAERIFAQQRAQGSTAMRIQAGQTASRMDVFDPEAEVIVIVPRVVGG